MSRSIVIFGNGVGLALDENLFRLRAGLEYVWSNTRSLSVDQKRLILCAISGTTDDIPPQSEEQLDKLQVAIVATEFLRLLHVDGVSWLSDPARGFPQAFRKFIHEVGLYFHRSEKSLPEQFSRPLSNFVNNTKSHIATLNYDNLIYDAFINSKVLNGYNGSLIDGFWSAGFDDEHLERKHEGRHGWYLHLHGSPLYIGNHKAMGVARSLVDADENCHIVLTHVEHKPLIIGSSKILSSYWRRLEMALEESERIILFGYSGLDFHLNDKIRLHSRKQKMVVEWQGAGSQEERDRYWQSVTSSNQVTVVRLENILSFSGW